MTPNITCPLGLPSAEPLEELTAEAVRNCNKLFSKLPYSERNVQLVKEVVADIIERGNLGFGEYKSSKALPDRMAETLRSKGFRVNNRYLNDDSIWYVDINPKLTLEEKARLSQTSYSIIQWDESLPEPTLAYKEFFSYIDSYNDRLSFLKEQEAERMKKLEEKMQREKESKEETEKAKAKYEADHKETMKEVREFHAMKPPSTGCLPLILAGLFIASGAVYFCGC